MLHHRKLKIEGINPRVVEVTTSAPHRPRQQRRTNRNEAGSLMTTTASATALSGLTAGTWTIDASHTEVGFVVRHMMVSKVKGRFSKVEGTITVAENLLDSSVEATVSAASIDTRDENRDNHLRSADFFDVENHPQWSFRSTGIRPDGSDYLLDGELTLKGVTRPVTFELEFNG